MKRLCLVGFLIVLLVILFSFSSFFVLAQYETTKTTNFTIPSSGITHIDQSTTAGGVSIDIAGTTSATGSVSTATYTGNPQPHASWPVNVTLTHFVAITINMDARYFQSANITVSYSNSDIAGINPPYTLYKYYPDTNDYVRLNSVVDTSAKTIAATVTSITDPLFAIGGTTAIVVTPTPLTSPVPPWIWAVVATIIIVVVLVVILLLFRRARYPQKNLTKNGATTPSADTNKTSYSISSNMNIIKIECFAPH